ncbi:hypothetical protein FACS1894193_12680 [Bacilli bacterium]|nr:hypothetical protein FACS1894193_12680 [Bacilli bacterium]
MTVDSMNGVEGRIARFEYYFRPAESAIAGVVAGVTTAKAIKATGKVPYGTENSNQAKSVPKRPSWRESEIDAELDYQGYETQKSFLNGKEVPYGTKGSTRPELYKDGHSIEVKNYDVQTNSGRNNLVNNVSGQIKNRVDNLPLGTNQTILVDIRGQNVTNDVLKEIRQRILEKTKVDVEIIFKR